MPIQIIPKEAAKLPLWQNILFYLSIALLLAFISGYSFLIYQTKKLDLALKDLETTLAKETTPQQISLEKEILDYKKKIEDFAPLITAHRLSSKFFGFFEKITHPKVFFSDLKIDIMGNKAGLSGQTESFQTLGQQILIFQKEELIKNVQLSKVQIGKEGKIEFSLEIFLDPKLFTP